MVWKIIKNTAFLAGSSIALTIAGFIYLIVQKKFVFSSLDRTDYGILVAIFVIIYACPVILYYLIYRERKDQRDWRAWKYVLKKLPRNKMALGIEWRVLKRHEMHPERHFVLQGPLCKECHTKMQKKVVERVKTPIGAKIKEAYVCPKCHPDRAIANKISLEEMNSSLGVVTSELMSKINDWKDEALGTKSPSYGL